MALSGLVRVWIGKELTRPLASLTLKDYTKSWSVASCRLLSLQSTVSSQTRLWANWWETLLWRWRGSRFENLDLTVHPHSRSMPIRKIARLGPEFRLGDAAGYNHVCRPLWHRRLP